MNLSEEQILALAPDDSSRKSGKDLSNPSKWVSQGGNETALWGECQGSGSKPYQTQIDLGNLAFKCSCPSRKFPCKHGLGLLLLRARNPDKFTTTEAPDWVKEWLQKRTEKEEKKTEKKDKPVDEAAQAKRQQARQQKVQDGISELNRWIKDLIRGGIINASEKGGAFWEGMAKRMIDAQASGLAFLVRNLGEVNFYAEGWQSIFLERLLKLYLITQGYTNIDAQDENMQEDLRGLIGFNRNQDELKAQEGFRDEWFVLAKQVSEEEQLTIERNWLYGTRGGRYALVMQFYVRSQLPGVMFTPGMVIDATLVFFPSAMPLRALVKEQHRTAGPRQPTGYSGWKEAAAAESRWSSIYPFNDGLPCIIRDLAPVFHQGSWWLVDGENQMMPLRKNDPGIWKLLSFSGGSALSLALIGKEQEYELAGAWHDQEYKIL